ncbi:MAG: DUF58 domain-containing protein [Aquificota bacterium]|nr:MAG: DUF58 domain-containing protein [Aquificota bacterium]
MIRYKVKVNRAGSLFVGISVFLGVAAVNTANNLLYIIVSFLLSFMLVSGLLSLYNLRGLRLEAIPPAEVYADTEASFRLILENTKRFPSFVIKVLEEGGSSFLFPMVKTKQEGRLSVKFKKRGFYPSLRLVVGSSFPVGLFERYYEVEVPINLVVFPKLLEASPSELLPFAEDKGFALHSTLRGYDVVSGVREYKGEPLKLIHWKTSAKRGELYVKDMYEESAKPVVINLDTLRGSLEERISKGAFLVVKFSREGRAVGLKVGGLFIEPSVGNGHRRELLKTLALL